MVSKEIHMCEEYLLVVEVVVVSARQLGFTVQLNHDVYIRLIKHVKHFFLRKFEHVFFFLFFFFFFF